MYMYSLWLSLSLLMINKFVSTACGKRVLLGIYIYSYFDSYFAVFVPERSGVGTKPLSQFLYQHVTVFK
jgi:hypothetical protein